MHNAEEVLGMCRLCMSKNNLSNIFKPTDDIGLDAKATNCVTIKVQIGDGLPTCICDQCESMLNNFYKFKLNCQITDTKLREALQNVVSQVKIKVESVDWIKTELDEDILNENDNFSDSDINDLHLDRENVSVVKEMQNEHTKFVNNTETFLRKHKSLDHKEIEITYENDNILKKQEKINTNILGYDSEEPSRCIIILKTENTKDKKTELPKLFQCEHCGSTFKTKVVLKKHFSVHSKLKPHICALCPKSYTRPENLRVHMRKHTGLRPFVCEICSKTFSKSQDLSRHKLIHYDEKKYPCLRCDKRFKRSADVHAHMRVHTGHHPFTCKVCPKSYKSHSGLKKHLKHHEKE